MKLTAEPTRAEPYGARIRRLFASPEATWPEPMALALLFAQDREQHRRDVVDPAIAQGLHVVCDRGLLSSLALQGPRVGFQAVLALNAGAKRPDLTLWLDLEPEQAAARLASRPGAMTAFEGHAALRAQAWAHAATVFRAAGLPLVRVSAQGHPDDVEAALRVAVEDHLLRSPSLPRSSAWRP